MARRRKKKSANGFVPYKGIKCSGQYFRFKTKRGVRCACAAFSKDGRFVSQFASMDACPASGSALTYAQAKKKYS